MPTNEEIAKSLGVPVSAVLTAQSYVDRKLSGQRIVVSSDPNVKKAWSLIGNDPEYLRQRSAVLGRGFGYGTSPLHSTQTYSGDPGKGVIQYDHPIGPSVPIAYDTEGNPVFPNTLSTKNTQRYKGADFFNPSGPVPGSTVTNGNIQSQVFENPSNSFRGNTQQPLFFKEVPGSFGLPSKVVLVKSNGQVVRTLTPQEKKEYFIQRNLQQSRVIATPNELEELRQKNLLRSNTQEQIISDDPQVSVDVTPFLSLGTGDVSINLEQENFNVGSIIQNFRNDLYAEQDRLSTERAQGKLGVGGRIEAFGVGFTGSIIDQAIGIKQLLYNPSELKSVPSAIKQEGISIAQNLKLGNTEYALGRTAGFYAGAKGIDVVGKGVVKISDVVRTSGLTKVPTESVIAPEFFKGQKYPSIRRGQTAGQLLKEFQSSDRLVGFTASPKPFSKETIAGKGSSELKGVYQSPKLSPQFLRITEGEKNLFTLNPFGTLRPSATIIKPITTELIKGVSVSQTNLFPLNKAKGLFISEAELGKSYVPFVKTEKEAVIPSGTLLKQTNKELYFNFEGRRIPIYEFEALPNGVKPRDIYSTSEVSKLSSSRVGKRGVFSPYDILKVSRSSGVSYPSSKISFSYSNPIPSKSFSKSKLSRSSVPSYTQTLSSVSKSLSSKSFIPSSISRGYNYNKGYSFFKTPLYKPIKITNQNNFFKPVKLFVKERGLFRFKGAFRTPQQASVFGQYLTGKDISRSFKVVGGNVGVPYGYRRSKKDPFVFVESKKFGKLTTLNTRSEILQIQSARRKRRR